MLGVCPKSEMVELAGDAKVAIVVADASGRRILSASLLPPARRKFSSPDRRMVFSGRLHSATLDGFVISSVAGIPSAAPNWQLDFQ